MDALALLAGLWLALGGIVAAADDIIQGVALGIDARTVGPDVVLRSSAGVRAERAAGDNAAFFATFDRDRDGALSWHESRAFYFWVEENVRYRFDDEAARDVPPGALVGDGRAGAEYFQSPAETLAERAGDCEDMAALEAAFHRHFGVPAFVAAVNARSPDKADHAVAVLWVAPSRATVPEALRSLPLTLVAQPFGPMPQGAYIVLDNALADAPGSLPRESGQGRLRIFDAWIP